MRFVLFLFENEYYCYKVKDVTLLVKSPNIVSSSHKTICDLAILYEACSILHGFVTWIFKGNSLSSNIDLVCLVT